MKLSVLIPAYNESGSIAETIYSLEQALSTAKIEHEVIVVNDHSDDDTEAILKKLCSKYATLKYINNTGRSGFGYAVRCGLEIFEGDCVAVMMADLSDSPEDLIRFYSTMLEKNTDCVFGTRWSRGGKVTGYPFIKRIINRIANRIIQVVMNINYNDTTNAFKLYKREVMDGVKPILSPHFNLTIELPLKAIIRGFSYTIVPNLWTNRKAGESKLKIKEMGSRYLFILIYCLIEKYFSKGDYKRVK